MHVRLVLVALAAAALVSWSAPTSAQQTLTVATNPQGSVGHAIGLGVAVVISKRTDVVARPVALGGGTAFLPQINDGSIELGTNNIIDNNFAVRGHTTFDGRPNPNLRGVARLVDFYAGLMVRVDSDIKSAKDFKGRPFPTEFTQQSIVKFTTEAMLATGGLGWDDIKPVPVVNFAKAIELLAARRIDGANGAPGSAIIQEANARTPIKFISIERSAANQAIMDRMVPGAAFADLDPAPYMPEIRETVTMLGFPFMLVTGTHVSGETIYKITKALYEAKPDLIAQHGVFRSFDPRKMAVDAADLKYHPGAMKFYAENGMWPPAKH